MGWGGRESTVIVAAATADALAVQPLAIQFLVSLYRELAAPTINTSFSTHTPLPNLNPCTCLNPDAPCLAMHCHTRGTTERATRQVALPYYAPLWSTLA